jgi:GNAT superfamily N-acetyltransferase
VAGVTVRELGPGETSLAAGTLLELRPGGAQALIDRIKRQRASGYRLAGAFAAGREEAVAVAGFRINEFLAWDKHLYVDDFVTAESYRGQGHADRLFAWLEAEARQAGCTQLHLDSAVGEHRQDAHRFYFRHGLRIAAFHFQREL